MLSDKLQSIREMGKVISEGLQHSKKLLNLQNEVHTEIENRFSDNLNEIKKVVPRVNDDPDTAALYLIMEVPVESNKEFNHIEVQEGGHEVLLAEWDWERFINSSDINISDEVYDELKELL